MTKICTGESDDPRAPSVLQKLPSGRYHQYYWAVIDVAPHRLQGLLSRSFKRDGYSNESFEESSREEGMAFSSKIKSQPIPQGTTDLTIFARVNNECQIAVSWSRKSAKSVNIAWTAHYPQGYQMRPVRNDARQVIALLLSKPAPVDLRKMAALPPEGPPTQPASWAPPEFWRQYETNRREYEAKQAKREARNRENLEKSVTLEINRQVEAERRFAGQLFVDPEEGTRFGQILSDEVVNEPPIPPEGPYVLGPGELLDGERLAARGFLDRDYSGCATETEIADLTVGVLPLGRWSFGATVDTLQHGPELFVPRTESGEPLEFQGTLVVAPSGQGKTQLVKRWAYAANAAGYHILLIDVQGHLRQALGSQMHGSVLHFTTDPKIPVSDMGGGMKSCDRLNFLQGLRWSTGEERAEIGKLAEVLLPSLGWKGVGGQEERTWYHRRMLLSSFLTLALMRFAYKPSAWAGRAPDLADVYSIALDEKVLLAAVDDISNEEAKRPAGAQVDFSVEVLKQQISFIVAPKLNGAGWGQRNATTTYYDWTAGVVEALRVFSPQGGLYEKVRAKDATNDFDLGRLSSKYQTTLILAARSHDEGADAVLSFAVKRIEQLLKDRIDSSDCRPILLLLDETARIREFDAALYVEFMRKARVATVLVYQSPSTIPQDSVDRVLRTVGTKIYLGNVPPETLGFVQAGLPRRPPTRELGWSAAATPHVPPVPALGEVELGDLCAHVGRFPALIFVRAAASAKPILADMDENPSETLRVGPSGYSSITLALDAAPPRARILISAGHYAEELEITKPVEFAAAGSGPVEIAGNVNLRSTQTALVGIAIQVVSLHEDAGSLALTDCEIQSLTLFGGTGRVTGRNAVIGTLNVFSPNGRWHVILCVIRSMRCHAVRSLLLENCTVSQSDFKLMDGNGHRYARDDPERPTEPLQITARYCRFEGPTNVADVDFSAQDCEFQTHPLTFPLSLPSNAYASHEQYPVALSAFWGSRVEINGGQIRGGIEGYSARIRISRVQHVGRIWPDAVPPEHFRRQATTILCLDNMEQAEFVDCEFDAGDSRQILVSGQVSFDRCSFTDLSDFQGGERSEDGSVQGASARITMTDSTLRIPSLAALAKVAEKVDQAVLSLAGGSITVERLAPGEALPARFDNVSVIDDYSGFSKKVDVRDYSKGSFAAGQWAFTRHDGIVSYGPSIYFPFNAAEHGPARYVATLTRSRSSGNSAFVPLIARWIAAADSAGYNVVWVTRRELSGEAIPPFVQFDRVTIPYAGTDNDGTSLLADLDLMCALDAASPSVLDDVEQLAKCLIELSGSNTYGNSSQQLAEVQETLSALTMLALSSFRHSPWVWSERHPDLGDVYAMVTSPSRLAMVAASIQFDAAEQNATLRDPRALNWDQALDRFRKNGHEISLPLMLALRPFARPVGDLSNITPLRALLRRERSHIFARPPERIDGKPGSGYSAFVRLVLAVSATVGTAVTERPLLLIAEHADELPPKDLAALLVAAKAGCVRVIIPLDDLTIYDPTMCDQTLRASDAICHLGSIDSYHRDRLAAFMPADALPAVISNPLPFGREPGIIWSSHYADGKPIPADFATPFDHGLFADPWMLDDLYTEGLSLGRHIQAGSDGSFRLGPNVFLSGSCATSILLMGKLIGGAELASLWREWALAGGWQVVAYVGHKTAVALSAHNNVDLANDTVGIDSRTIFDRKVTPLPSYFEEPGEAQAQWIRRVATLLLRELSIAETTALEPWLTSLMIVALLRLTLNQQPGPRLAHVHALAADQTCLSEVINDLIATGPEKATLQWLRLSVWPPSFAVPYVELARQLLSTSAIPDHTASRVHTLLELLEPFKEKKPLFRAGRPEYARIHSLWDYISGEHDQDLTIAAPTNQSRHLHSGGTFVADLLSEMIDYRSEISLARRDLLMIVELHEGVGEKNMAAFLAAANSCRGRTNLVFTCGNLADLPAAMRQTVLSQVNALVHIGPPELGTAEILAKHFTAHGGPHIAPKQMMDLSHVHKPGLAWVRDRAGGRPFLVELPSAALDEPDR